MKNLDFYFYSVLKNEDANPYVGSDVIAVADGLGGSGSAVHTLRPEQYETLRQVLYKTVLPGNGWREDPHLSAYFESLFRPMTDSHPDTSALWASRIVMARFVYAAAKCRNSLGDLADPQARRRLAGFLEGGLRDVAAEFRLEKGRFGGQQLLPTTFASVFLREEEEGFVTAEAVWAGDSRCYALTGEGLKPLSVDDEDGTGAITNLFCVGEKEAVLHYRRFHLKKPCAVFACSDGVFDPYAGHEHLCVENVLLREIGRSTSAGELRSRLHDHYKRIHADDATMAFRSVGFDSYAAMKRFFAPRAADVARMYDRLCRFRSHLEVAACSEDEVAGYVRSRTSDKFEAVVEETDGACRRRRDRLLGEIRAQFEANPASAHLFFARSKKLAGVGKKCEREAARIVELARALCGAQKEYEAKDGAVKRLYREYAESKRVAREHADRLYSAYRTFRADPARRAEGVRVALLTGDHEEAARHVAAALHLDDLRASCLPEDKLRWIEDRDREGRRVCMIGDGINDAPALKKAFVSVAMGGIGSDIAVDAADMALVRDDIRRLPHMLALSRRMMRVICINLTFSLVLNFAAIFLAMGGLLSPVAGALVHNAGSVLVIVHSALLLRWQEKNARKSTGRPLTSTGAGRNVNPSI